MKPDDCWRLSFLEVAAHSIPYRLAQLVEGIGLRVDGSAQRSRGEASFRGVRDLEDDLVHLPMTVTWLTNQKLGPKNTAFANSGSSPRHRSRKFGSPAKAITLPSPTRSVQR